MPPHEAAAGIVAALLEWRRTRKLNQKAAAAEINCGAGVLSGWESGRRYPARKYWPRLVAAGIATRDQLRAWRPAPPSQGEQLARARQQMERAARRILRILPTGLLPPDLDALRRGARAVLYDD